MQTENAQAVAVFFVPSRWDEKTQTKILPIVIDTAHQRNGKCVSFYRGETLDELRKRYPTAELGDLDQVLAEKEAMMRTEPTQCTEQDFQNAFECLPPWDWQHAGSAGESFKHGEPMSGRMTRIYARLGTSYWSFTDLVTMPHREIMNKVFAALEKSPPAFRNGFVPHDPLTPGPDHFENWLDRIGNMEFINDVADHATMQPLFYYAGVHDHFNSGGLIEASVWRL